uniref:Uncharacterized protein n=1 Tax=Brassica campestris TaxID=3711 RepID=A0A3P6C7S8_BRACM|nr:unnamed protein product [Brassica rapa]
MCRQNCCAKSSQEEEVISPPDENLLIYCKHVRLYNILRIRSLYNVNQLREVVTDGEKSKAGKKRAKAPWAKPLSQYSQAHVHELGFSEMSKVFVFKGNKEVSKNQVLDQLRLSSRRVPTSGFPKRAQNGFQSAAGVNRFLLHASDCEYTLDLEERVDNNNGRCPTFVDHQVSTLLCLGAAGARSIVAQTCALIFFIIQWLQEVAGGTTEVV